MKKSLLFALLLASACLTQAAPIKVALVSDSDALRAALVKSGVQVVALDALDTADVLALQSTDLKPLPGLERAAVEAFVKRGGGVVIVGGAIDAGDWLKPIAGGAWTAQSREFNSKMMLFALTDAHPITRSATPFDIDDETVYDLDLDPRVNVLASAFTPKITNGRVEQRSSEKLDRANVYDLQPQMWTFEAADKHRAFVLLPGQPDTLKHASIRSFILRGVAWAARRENLDELCAPEDLASLRYPQGGARTATETMKSFEMQPGFKASVIASEPLITKPIAMQWDARGRLWIAETPEYPNGRRPMVATPWKETGALVPGKYDRPATDRISILSDPDVGGQFTKKTVFYEGLELVTGFCVYGDGVIAVHQPDIVFIHGEGAARRVERLYGGFTPGDTHFVANHFIVAPDGWIYADTGSGPSVQSVAHPEVKARLSSGLFRFKADGSAIEQVSSKGGNSFGADVTSDGELFFGQATTGNPVQHVVLPEWILNQSKVGSLSGAESVIKQRKVARLDLPDRAPFMQIDVVGGYSSACASTVYEAGAWPAEWNYGVFCTEPILDIIHFEKLVPKGATFTGNMVRTDAEWLRARDFWFFPVDVEFGPDGAMYVLDFYCPIVAHNDTRGPQHSRSGASVRPDRDHYFGRIYRIQHDAATPLERLDLTQADAPTLVKTFTHPNRLTRFTAHRLLMDRADAPSVIPQLTAMAEGESFVPARILALWALERLGQLEPRTLEAALKSDSAGVRKSALLMVEALGPKNTVEIAPLMSDPDARVRLTALRALASSPLTAESAAKLLAMLPTLDDAWSRSAAVAAASSNPGALLQAALAAPGTPNASLLELATSLATTITEKKDGAALASVIIAAAAAPANAAPIARAVLEAAGAAPPAAPVNRAGLDDALRTLLTSADRTLSVAALPLAVGWAAAPLNSVISQRVDDLLALTADAQQTDDARAAAVRSLIRSRGANPRIVASVIALLKTPLSDPLLLDVIAALASTGDPSLGQALASVLPNLSPIGQNAAFEALVRRVAWANAVLDALQAKTLKPTTLGSVRMSKLRLHSDPATAKRAREVIDEIGAGSNPVKDEIIAKLLPEVESKTGDPVKGKAAFQVTCAICHKFNGEGKEVGPVLDGIGVHGTHELLIHIIDPSRVVDNEHRTWNIALKDGTFATGIIARENNRSLTLRLGGGVEQEISIADLKSREETGLSLMPEGFEALGADGLRDILAYLSAGSAKFRAVNLGRAFTTDTGAGLYQSREQKADTVQPVKYGINIVEGVPFSLPDPSTTPVGGNVIVLKSGDAGTYSSTLPQRVEIPVGFAAGNLHFLGGVAGWGGGPDLRVPAMKVTIEHANGQRQVEELYTGDVFIDYVSSEDVPGSKRVNGVTKTYHVRYFSLPVNDPSPIKSIALESYKNGIAPTTLAITADTDAPKPRRKYTLTQAAPKPAETFPKSGETLPAQAAPGLVRALLIGGGSSHDFERYFHQADSATLKAAKIAVAYTSNLEEALALMPNADVIVLSANHAQFGAPAFQQALNAFADAGKGLVIVHAGAWYNWPASTGYNQRFLGGGAKSHGRGEFTVFNKQPAHPVMQGVPADFKIIDEHYRIILEGPTPVEVLAETDVEPQSKKTYPSVWVVKDPKTRIVGIALGHADEAHSNPAYQKILINSVRWVALRP